MKVFFSFVAFALLLSGCHTINIKNGPDSSLTYQQDEWHHIGVLSLVEFSDPVNLNDRCSGKDWAAVRTRQSVGQVFLGLVPYLSLAWSPREVAIECR